MDNAEGEGQNAEQGSAEAVQDDQGQTGTGGSSENGTSGNGECEKKAKVMRSATGSTCIDTDGCCDCDFSSWNWLGVGLVVTR